MSEGKWREYQELIVKLNLSQNPLKPFFAVIRTMPILRIKKQNEPISPTLTCRLSMRDFPVVQSRAGQAQISIAWRIIFPKPQLTCTFHLIPCSWSFHQIFWKLDRREKSKENFLFVKEDHQRSIPPLFDNCPTWELASGILASYSGIDLQKSLIAFPACKLSRSVLWLNTFPQSLIGSPGWTTITNSFWGFFLYWESTRNKYVNRCEYWRS